MDSMITACARALAVGDVLSALKLVALRDDPPALALRGIALARLGQLARARELLRDAARGFGAHEAVARARCVVAAAEVALAERDFRHDARALMAAQTTLESHGDLANAMQARLIGIRRHLLLGQLAQAQAALAACEMIAMPPALTAVAQLTIAGLAMRRLHPALARSALELAQRAAESSQIAALQAEVAQAYATLQQPAARHLQGNQTQLLTLDQVAAVRASDALVVDACRCVVGSGANWRGLQRRPVLFALLRTLAQAWPADVSRDTLIARVFRIRHADETHRVRLRVELGRLRTLLRGMAGIEATVEGFVLIPEEARRVVLLVPPVDSGSAALQALLADGAAWSTSALALALGASQRTVQRALAELESKALVHAIGQARQRRWLAPPLAGCTTILLLPAQMALV